MGGRREVAILVALTLAWAGPIAFEDWSDRVDAPIVGSSDGLHGVALFDPDGDGDLDVWHTNGIRGTSYLLLNDGRGGLSHGQEAWGVASGGAHSGVLTIDLDDDGLVDVVELSDGAMKKLVMSPARVLWNRGDHFEETADGLLVDLLPPSQMVAAAADIDQDGDLDVFVGAPGRFKVGIPDESVLLRNDGGRFTDITAEAGLAGVAGCAAMFAHTNDDALPDLMVAGCLFGPHTVRQYVNQGDGTFVNVGDDERLWESGWWMGIAANDFDHDGITDFFVSNIGSDAGAPHALYLRTEDDWWVESATAAGVDSAFYGWGVTAPDFDNDGDDDLLLVGGPRNKNIAEFASPGELWAGDGAGGFEPMPLPVDLKARSASGLAQGDLDGDGFPDVVVGVGQDPNTNLAGAPVLLRNVGNDHGWLTVRLVQEPPNALAVGALIEATLPDGRQVRREVRAGSSFASTETPWPTLGLGAQEQASVMVRWPDGVWEDFGAHDAGQRLDLVRGEGRPPVVEEEGGGGRSQAEAGGGCATVGGGFGWGWSRRR